MLPSSVPREERDSTNRCHPCHLVGRLARSVVIVVDRSSDLPPKGDSSDATSTPLSRSIKKASLSGEASVHVVFGAPYAPCCPSPHKSPPIIGSSISTRLIRAKVGFGVTSNCAFLHGNPFRVCLWYGRGTRLSTFLARRR